MVVITAKLEQEKYFCEYQSHIDPFNDIIFKMLKAVPEKRDEFCRYDFRRKYLLLMGRRSASRFPKEVFSQLQ